MDFFSTKPVFFLLTSLTLLFNITQAATVIVDGVSEWKDPSVQVGDSIIFEHKYHYKLYIFKNWGAFNLCNFTQATLLTKPNSTSYTWHPSRLGFFYFSFNNGSTAPCQERQKLAIKVSLSKNAPEQPPMAAPPLSSGGVVSSSPSYPWPFRPRDSTSPSPAPGGVILPATGPSGGIPFINSNPAVPLPTGEVDSATIGPLPVSGGHTLQVMVIYHFQSALCWVLFLLVLL